MTIQRYELQFRKLFANLFEKRAYFREAFGNTIETTDGISNATNAFHLKKNVDKVVMKAYDTSADTTFGNHTSWSRFGEMKEIKYTDVPVPYNWNYAAHEGLDRFTVNANLGEAVADRMAKIVEEKIVNINKSLGKALIDKKQKEITAASAGADDLVKMFNEAYAYFENAEVRGTKRAYVTPELYTLLVDLNLTTTAKNAGVNIDDNSLRAFKGFVLMVVPSAYFGSGEEDVIFTVDGVGVAFTGIETARTKEGDQFDGIEIQVAGKFGQFIPDENKPAILTGKVTSLPAI